MGTSGSSGGSGTLPARPSLPAVVTRALGSAVFETITDIDVGHGGSGGSGIGGAAGQPGASGLAVLYDPTYFPAVTGTKVAELWIYVLTPATWIQSLTTLTLSGNISAITRQPDDVLTFVGIESGDVTIDRGDERVTGSLSLVSTGRSSVNIGSFDPQVGDTLRIIVTS